MMKRLIIYLLLPFCCYTVLHTDNALLPNIGKPFFISKSEAKQQEVEVLKKRLEEFKKNSKYQPEKIEANLETIKNDIAETKNRLKVEYESEFLSKRLIVLSEQYQALKDLNQVIERFAVGVNEYIQLLEEYLKDPELQQYYQELGTCNRVAFSFEDLRQIKEKIDFEKTAIELLQQQDAHTLAEVKSREQAASTLMQQYKQKKDQQERLDDRLDVAFDLNEKQKRELANLEFALLGVKRDIDDLQLQILELRIKKIRIKIELKKIQLQILQDAFACIKQSSIHISEADLIFAKEELEKKRQKLNVVKIESYDPKREEIKREIEKGKERLEQLSKQHAIAVSEDLDEWSNKNGTTEFYVPFLAVAQANALVMIKKLELEQLESQIALEDQSLFLERIATDIKTSFYKMYVGKLLSEEKILEEIKRYEARLSDIKVDLSQLENKKTTLDAQLTVAKRALANITEKKQGLLNQKEKLSKANNPEYAQMKEILQNAEEVVNKQIKILDAVRSTYGDTVLKLTKTEQQIRFTIEELRVSSRNIIWDRTEDAISLQGIMLIVPNIETFFYDIRSYIVHFDLVSLLYKIKNGFKQSYKLFYFILYTIFWLLFLVTLYFFLPYARAVITKLSSRTSRMRVILCSLVDFMRAYYIYVAIWGSWLLLLNFYIIPDPYPYIIFYLLSIPCLLVWARSYINYLTFANLEHDYVLIRKEYIRRFMISLSLIMYGTIVIFFFRKAFILANYPKSELPNILKALNIIILQISIILLVTKEALLSLLPRNNDFWEWIRDYIIERYYYLLLLIVIVVVVMVNPYVGFGRLVIFLLSRMAYTIMLLGMLFWVHGLVKRWSSSLFFHTDQDGVKERFPVAKTWYGVSIICILLSFVFFGAIIVAKIWQWPERLKNIKEMRDIVEWLQTPILLQNTQSPLSVYTISQFMFFLLSGFLAATAIRRFVLNRIFDVLLVDSGVQNTVDSLMRYVIYLMAVMLGLNAIGLGTQINLMITALLVGLGIIIKDPAADFFAYFIILVQRPIKIGDYIRIDTEVTGVVRKITPRSIVLRRKNSTMIIVPNSYVVNHTIINWNYIRGFIAFEDIHVVVSYKEDPAKIKEIFEYILDSSPYVLKNPKPVVRLHEFNQHGLEFLLRGFISSNYTLDQWDIASDIRLQIVKVFKQHNIEFALPIRLMVNHPAQLSLKEKTDLSSIEISSAADASE